MKERLKLDVAYAQQPFPGKDQDRLLVRDAVGLYAVIDGMSNPSGGAIAADIIKQTLAEHATEHMIIGSVLFESQKRLMKMHSHGFIEKEAGAVVTACQIDRSSRVMNYTQIGDSRMMLFRRFIQQDGSVDIEPFFFTKAELFGGGVSNFVGAYNPATFVIDQYGKLQVQVGDRIVIMTDGIDGGANNYETTNKLWEHVINEGTALSCAQKLLNLCYQDMDYVLERHDPYYIPDDKTVIVIDVE